MVSLARFRLTLTAIAAACLVTVPGAAWAQNASQAQAGLTLAQRYCVRCHVVVPSASKGWTDAPPFQTIANRPGTTVASLSAFIQQQHMHMLNTGRPRNEANQIAAYIVSLRDSQAPVAH